MKEPDSRGQAAGLPTKKIDSQLLRGLAEPYMASMYGLACEKSNVQNSEGINISRETH
jgi:hypothetical protein